MSTPSILSCPICHGPLIQNGKAWQCNHRHHFDQAKEGYVNLLAVQFKHSKNPGDNATMLKARQLFLQQGYYQPLADALIQMAATAKSYHQILDMGCGEGFYTDQLRQLDAQVWGLDIAKRGIQQAAKRYPECRFVVASNQRLPFADQSLDLITRIFAPQDDSQVMRCLRPGAALITVVPGAWHLKQLRQYIYPELRAHVDVPETLPGLTHQQSQTICYPMTLDANSREQLMDMTPFAWKLTRDTRQQFIEDKSPVDAQFTLHHYTRDAH
ncbi:23S rRNA (guanine(745)-N(1))-methyltransferase [Celerinatantimonas yamalensis]|uniref:23S rRNA (Guanine(745)-N(1))-methyltransferase n=1 Tax=Celerinatantimonas yamalensis TaxID=559956 RepID=A0ABW9G6M1_9GAMM